MRNEHDKGLHEINIFMRFVEASNIRLVPNSANKRLPPEPDILCEIRDEGLIAFELVEICDKNWAQATSMPFEKIPMYLRTKDPTEPIVAKKAAKRYPTKSPIELLCYTEAAVFTPYQIILQTISQQLAVRSSQFRRAWLFTNGEAHKAWEAQGTATQSNQ